MTTFIRYRFQGETALGLCEGEEIAELQGDLFSHRPTGVRRKRSEVTTLAPLIPTKILAVGRNFKSHAGNRPLHGKPELFFKPVTSLLDPEAPVVIPRDARNVHYEGELVLIISQRLKHASLDEARAAIFGVTCGNDISERDWQLGPERDISWWRAKGSDTFGAIGPVVVTGLDYDNLRIRTRLNGEVVQDESTAAMIYDCATVVSFTSRYVTLERGDIIYMGTPGQTRPMKAGDTVEVEVEGIGVLRNPVIAEA
jgi:2-keto-4-pentenoate hydratase/2-oxohepta-3-ene-1,7-dioic acid hydratase in catechol pathway